MSILSNSYSPPSSRSRAAEPQGSWDREGGRGGRRVEGDNGVSFYGDRESSRPGRYGGAPRGAVQLKLENLPEDMSWQELKQLGGEGVVLGGGRFSHAF